MSCGTCHIPAAGGTDIRAGGVHSNGNIGSFGVIRQHQNPNTGEIDYNFLANPSPSVDRLITGLHAPTMIGAYMFETLFWDQRAGPGFKIFDVPNSPVFPGFQQNAALEDLAVGPVISDVEMGHENIAWGSGFIQSKLNESYPLALVDPATVPGDIMWLIASGRTYDMLFDAVFFSHPQSAARSA
jgi:cytochrome c peroxidase